MGENIKPSKPFVVDAFAGQRVALDVDPASSGVGEGLTIGGAILGGAGFLALGTVAFGAGFCSAVSGPNNLQDAPPGGCWPLSTALTLTAVGALALGAVIVVVGVVTDRPTRVEPSTNPTTSGPTAPPRSERLVSALRSEAELERQAPGRLAPPMSLPMLTIAF